MMWNFWVVGRKMESAAHGLWKNWKLQSLSIKCSFPDSDIMTFCGWRSHWLVNSSQMAMRTIWNKAPKAARPCQQQRINFTHSSVVVTSITCSIQISAYILDNQARPKPFRSNLALAWCG